MKQLEEIPLQRVPSASNPDLHVQVEFQVSSVILMKAKGQVQPVPSMQLEQTG